MPEGMGALIGSLIGLLAVAASALFGFWQIKRAQIHQAEIQQSNEDRRQFEQARSLALGLRAELLSIQRAFTEFLVAPEPNWDFRHGHDNINKLASIYPRPTTKFFDRNINIIYMLPHKLLSDIFDYYYILNTKLENYKYENSKMRDKIAAQAYYNKKIMEIEQLKEYLEYLVVRLGSFGHDGEDIGGKFGLIYEKSTGDLKCVYTDFLYVSDKTRH